MIDPSLCTPEAYFTDLRNRMREAGVSANRLAKACQPPVAPSQVSRWMRKRLDPMLSTVGRLETALAKLTNGTP